nr:MAG TPA: hypothetical protein [Caudoviricetes sp.]
MWIIFLENVLTNSTLGIIFLYKICIIYTVFHYLLINLQPTLMLFTKLYIIFNTHCQNGCFFYSIKHLLKFYNYIERWYVMTSEQNIKFRALKLIEQLYIDKQIDEKIYRKAIEENKKDIDTTQFTLYNITNPLYKNGKFKWECIN